MTERTRAALRAIDLVDRADLRVGGLETLGVAEHFDLIVTHFVSGPYDPNISKSLFCHSFTTVRRFGCRLP